MKSNLDNINLMTLIEKYNMENNIDNEIIIQQDGTLLNLIDASTGKSIGIIKGFNLEDAYARMFTKMADHVRINKSIINKLSSL